MLSSVKKKYLWQRLRATQFYSYKHKYLEGNLIEWSFMEKKKKFCGLHSRAWNSHSHGLLNRIPVPGRKFSPVDQALIPIRKWFVITNSHITTAPVGTSCLEDGYCSIWSSVLGKIINVFSFPEAFTAHSNSMKACQQEGTFLVSVRLLSQWAAAKVYYVSVIWSYHIVMNDSQVQ